MSNIPEQLRYTEEHEWIAGTEGPLTVGITAYAADALGDIVFLDLPDEGDEVIAGEPCGEAESTKSVSDIYAPVTGEIVAVNAAVEQDPGIVNADPYGEGWLFRVRPAGDVTGLMAPEAYAKLTAES